MHLSALTLYFVLMLDSINKTLFWCVGILLLAAVITLIISLCCSYPDYSARTDEHKAIWTSGKKSGRRLIVAAVLLAVINTFIPTTKQMAAIIVLPAIMNNENVQKEAGDLYLLAKQGLAKLVKDDDKPQAEEESKKEETASP